jgi:hypothetical protein
MGVLFGNVSNQRIDFSTVAALQVIQQKTFLFWIDFTSLAGGEIAGLSPTGATDEEWGLTVPAAGGGANRLFFYADWSTTQGFWYTTNALTTGLHLLGLTYDYGSTANDPSMFVDGASVGVTEQQAPVGTYRTGLSNVFRLGSFTVGSVSINARIHAFTVLSGLWAAADFLQAYNSRLLLPSRKNLICAPNLLGTAGGKADGDTMAAGNTVKDLFNTGITGTPNASPVFKNNNVLSLGGA